MSICINNREDYKKKYRVRYNGKELGHYETLREAEAIERKAIIKAKVDSRKGIFKRSKNCFEVRITYKGKIHKEFVKTLDEAILSLHTFWLYAL